MDWENLRGRSGLIAKNIINSSNPFKILDNTEMSICWQDYPYNVFIKILYTTNNLFIYLFFLLRIVSELCMEGYLTVGHLFTIIITIKSFCKITFKTVQNIDSAARMIEFVYQILFIFKWYGRWLAKQALNRSLSPLDPEILSSAFASKFFGWCFFPFFLMNQNVFCPKKNKLIWQDISDWELSE